MVSASYTPPLKRTFAVALQSAFRKWIIKNAICPGGLFGDGKWKRYRNCAQTATKVRFKVSRCVPPHPCARRSVVDHDCLNCPPLTLPFHVSRIPPLRASVLHQDNIFSLFSILPDKKMSNLFPRKTGRNKVKTRTVRGPRNLTPTLPYFHIRNPCSLLLIARSSKILQHQVLADFHPSARSE